MYSPSKINIDANTNRGILIFRPKRAAKDVANIGPKNQAKGKLKKSAINALGNETTKTRRNLIEKICLKFSLLKGITWLFCIYHEFRFHRNWKDCFFDHIWDL